MGGKIIYTPPSAHQCSNMPVPERLAAGTKWQCDECHRKWVVVCGQGEDGKGYSAWRKLTDRNINGEDKF